MLLWLHVSLVSHTDMLSLLKSFHKKWYKNLSQSWEVSEQLYSLVYRKGWCTYGCPGRAVSNSYSLTHTHTNTPTACSSFRKHDWHVLEKLVLHLVSSPVQNGVMASLLQNWAVCQMDKDKPSGGLVPSEEEWCSLWFSPVPKGKMATEGSEHTSLCLISSSAPRTQPTVPSPPHTSTRKEGTLENVWNLHWETKQRGKETLQHNIAKATPLNRLFKKTQYYWILPTPYHHFRDQLQQNEWKNSNLQVTLFKKSENHILLRFFTARVQLLNSSFITKDTEI